MVNRVVFTVTSMLKILGISVMSCMPRVIKAILLRHALYIRGLVPCVRRLTGLNLDQDTTPMTAVPRCFPQFLD
jgi:hypothetical protein